MKFDSISFMFGIVAGLVLAFMAVYFAVALARRHFRKEDARAAAAAAQAQTDTATDGDEDWVQRFNQNGGEFTAGGYTIGSDGKREPLK